MSEREGFSNLNKLELSKLDEIFNNVVTAEDAIAEILLLLDNKLTKGMQKKLKRGLILKEVRDALEELDNAGNIFSSMPIDWEKVQADNCD